MTLDDIGRKYESDRSSLVHDYLRHYEFHLAGYREKAISVVDFGDSSIAGIQTWREYFPLARVIGVFESMPKMASSVDSGFMIENASQSNEAELVRLGIKYRPNFVVDDASHLWPAQIACLECIYPYLAPGGLYFLEDLQTSFGQDAKIYNGGTRVSTYQYIQSLLPGIAGDDGSGSTRDDDFAQYFRLTCDSVTLARKLCIIRKRADISDKIYTATPFPVCVPRAKELDNGGTYIRRPIECLINAPEHIVKEVEAETANKHVSPPSSYVGTLSNCSVYAHGVIVAEKDMLVSETFKNMPSRNRFSGFYRVGQSNSFVSELPTAPKHNFEDKTFAILRQMNEQNYGHWLVECLPRVDVMSEVHQLHELTFVVSDASPSMKRVYVDSLSLFGIQPTQILFLGNDPVSSYQLVFATPITHTPWVLSPRSIAVLERIGRIVAASDEGKLGPRKLYVSRNKYPTRRIVNEENLLEMLVERGYVTIYPEGMTFFEQVLTFSAATHVVGNLGAGLTNLVFAPRGCKLLALVTQYMHDDFYIDLQGHKLGTYASLHGNAVDPNRGMSSDFEVDTRELAQLLSIFDKT